jgi:hypothetical protein
VVKGYRGYMGYKRSRGIGRALKWFNSIGGLGVYGV